MNNISLKYRFAIIIFLLEMIMISLVLWQTQKHLLKATQDQLETHQRIILNLLGDLSRFTLITGEYGELQPYVENVQQDPHVLKILLVDDQNRIVVSTEPSLLGEQQTFPEEQHTQWETVKLFNPSGHLGILAIQFSNAHLIELQDEARILGAKIAGGSMVIIAVVGVLIGYLLTRRLEKLTLATQRLAEGEMNVKINMSGSDEIANLSNSFDMMSDKLKMYMSELIESEKKYRNLLEGLNDAAYRMSLPDGKYEYFSPAAKNIFGYDADDWLNNPLLITEIIHPDFTNYFSEKWEDLLKGNVPEFYEYRIIDPKGDERWILQSNTGIFDDQNSIIAIEGLCRDVTERKRAEEALTSSELKYRNLFNSILYGYALHEIILDKETGKPIDYRFLEMNPAFNDHTNMEAVTGLKAKDIIGKTVLELLPETEEHWIKEYGKVALTGKSIEFEATSDALGKYFHVSAFQNQPGQFAVVFSDITEQKQAKEQIKASLKEKETLLQEIHHRVKNNMAVVSSLLGLQAAAMKDEPSKEALRDSQNRVHSMSAIHETLYQSENLSAIDMKVYLSKLVKGVAQNYNIGSKVNLVIEAENILIGVKQASPLGLIVNELLTNSFKYAFSENQKGEIKISMQRSADQFEMAYADNGTGIPVNLDWKNASSMGLKLVKMLAENQLDGSIDMEPGNGTKFIIKFNIDHI